LRRTDGVGHDRAADAERPFGSDRRIARGLVLNLGIELRADQHHDGR
jgi:hypothetical protein